ncbi:MAG: aspartate kinase, partial [Gammaproteobacteria bacterium]|nr:aspartate kinase [Gammaproteobacteria bacterium]
MTILVKKFGGTSVGSIERLHNVADIIIKAQQEHYKIVAVVSAMNGETDRLIALAQQAVAVPEPREYDALVATGEQISMSLLSMILNARGHPTRSYNGSQAGIQTDNQHKKA